MSATTSLYGLDTDSLRDHIYRVFEEELTAMESDFHSFITANSMMTKPQASAFFEAFTEFAVTQLSESLSLLLQYSQKHIFPANSEERTRELQQCLKTCEEPLHFSVDIKQLTSDLRSTDEELRRVTASIADIRRGIQVEEDAISRLQALESVSASAEAIAPGALCDKASELSDLIKSACRDAEALLNKTKLD